MIKTLVVDDNPGFRKRVRDFLVNSEICEVVGEANDGNEALRKISELKPSLVLMDVRMSGMDGLHATQQLKDEFPEVDIIILSKYDLHEYREAARIRGASGYVVKMNMVEDLLPTILQVEGSGGEWIHNGFAESSQGVGKHTAADD